jgi:hypothetical protein
MSDYSYGVTPGATATGYISEEELMSWLESKSTEQYDRIRGEMEIATTRGKLMQDLAQLRTALDQASENPEAALAEVGALEAAYAGTPFEAELTRALAPIKADLELYENAIAVAAMNPPPDDPFVVKLVEEMSARMGYTPAGDGQVKGQAGSLSYMAQFYKSHLASKESSYADTLRGLTDSFSREDQLSLISIQAGMSELREAQQLASNMMASTAQTASSIISNYRG